MVYGGDLDWYKSYAQRGNLPMVQDTAEAAMAIMPFLGRIRLLRHWAGVMDMSMDGSFFICKTPLSNLYLNAGWNYGGFKASPASGWYFADLIANEQPHKNVQNHNLDRFEFDSLSRELPLLATALALQPQPWETPTAAE